MRIHDDVYEFFSDIRYIEVLPHPRFFPYLNARHEYNLRAKNEIILRATIESSTTVALTITLSNMFARLIIVLALGSVNQAEEYAWVPSQRLERYHSNFISFMLFNITSPKENASIVALLLLRKYREIIFAHSTLNNTWYQILKSV